MKVYEAEVVGGVGEDEARGMNRGETGSCHVALRLVALGTGPWYHRRMSAPIHNEVPS